MLRRIIGWCLRRARARERGGNRGGEKRKPEKSANGEISIACTFNAMHIVQKERKKRKVIACTLRCGQTILELENFSTRTRGASVVQNDCVPNSTKNCKYDANCICDVF